MSKSAMTNPDHGYQFAFRDCALLLYDALVEDSFYITMEQSADQQDEQDEPKEALLRYLDYSMVEARDYGTLYFPEAHRHGVAIWSQPLPAEREAQKNQAKLEFLQRHMGEASTACYNDITAFMSRQSDSIVDASAWYLSILGIMPEFQNQGLGGPLIRATLQRADRAGVPVFLETFTLRNESFYQRFGFRVAGSFFEPTIAARYSVMVRE
jgi:GNAT superfamily N-acetyltransferase